MTYAIGPALVAPDSLDDFFALVAADVRESNRAAAWAAWSDAAAAAREEAARKGSLLYPGITTGRSLRWVR